MKLLLDTHLLLWAAGRPDLLSAEALALIGDTGSELTFSAVSLWEVAIKNALGRADFSVNLRALRRGLLENGYREVPVLGEHALALETLPPHHRDPFDRMLVAQARIEGITLLTSDATLARYGEPVRKV
ncbi:type II toxin-antitoxin system VapC family toxin [Bosea sp. (in: a-proteobacteria)]|uniref:type II toxin-antitoxin system VapC family toxin n=1 Tax=Bosea sp. (in: a-proteobacteria) TaxID=1871050 RepID=UPI002FC6BF89